jgi:hypothetical protein
VGRQDGSDLICKASLVLRVGDKVVGVGVGIHIVSTMGMWPKRERERNFSLRYLWWYLGHP